MCNFQNIVSIISIIISFIVLIIAIIIPKITLINQIFFDLIKEYSTSEFNYALIKLWDIYNKIEFKNEFTQFERIEFASKIIVPKYIKEYETDIKINDLEKYRNTLHNSRRLVSHYFQKIAFLKYNGYPRLSKYRIRKYFDVTQFKLLELIIPIELIAIPYLLTKRPPKLLHDKDKYIYKLLIDSIKWSNKWKEKNKGYINKLSYNKLSKIDIDNMFYKIINNEE